MLAYVWTCTHDQMHVPPQQCSVWKPQDLPDARELLQKHREILQQWELQTRVLKELGRRSEKVLTATGLQEGI